MGFNTPMAEQMSESEIESKVVEAVAEQLGIAKGDVTRDSEFDKICDSLDKAELMMEFEDLFEISITDDSASRIVTVADAVRFIQQSLGDGSSAAGAGS
jgi:acyl carrier protein